MPPGDGQGGGPAPSADRSDRAEPGVVDDPGQQDRHTGVDDGRDVDRDDVVEYRQVDEGAPRGPNPWPAPRDSTAARSPSRLKNLTSGSRRQMTEPPTTTTTTPKPRVPRSGSVGP